MNQPHQTARAGPRLLTQTEYAKHRGCSKVAVHKAIATGRITAIGDAKLIDPAVADIQWRINTRPRAETVDREPPVPEPVAGGAQPPAAPPIGDDAEPYHVSRARRERAEAELAELRLAEERRDLIRVAAVRAALAATVAATREALLQLPSRLATPLAAESDAGRVYEQLHAEIVQALEQITAAPARIAPDEVHDDGA